MRILHVITGLPKAAGTSVFCAEICNGLVGLGHDITIAVCNPDAVDCYPLDSQVNVISIEVLLKTSGRTLFDLVHIHALWTPILCRVARWSKQNEIPIVWSPHGMLTPWALNNKKWKKRLAWRLYQKHWLLNANLLHATAESEVVDLRRIGLGNKVVVVPLGVYASSDVEHVEHEDKKILLFVSRVQKKKGLMNLVEAWSRFPADMRRGWKVRIVGPDQEGHTVELKMACKRLGVSGDFVFVGPKFDKELEAEYAAADVFVLPTYSENFGSVVIEALSRHLPVICTTGAPWRELEVRRCGWWIDVGVDPLVGALKEAMGLSDRERRKMGTNGRQLVEEKYTWDVAVREMEKGYLLVSG